MKALLVLEDGFTLEGDSFTGEFETGGEVIFTTSMTGYQEILTDPSYYGQMLCMTYPLIGNYGITKEDYESSTIHANALIVKECCKKPCNWRSCMTLTDFLHQHNVPGIENIDTRALTRHIRLHGAMRGVISTKDLNPKSLQEKALALAPMQGQNLVQYVACREPYSFAEGKPHKAQLAANGAYAWQGTGIPIIVYDFGIKWNILRLLIQHGFEPLPVPPSFSFEQVQASGAKGVFLSNGPGDPATLTQSVTTVEAIIKAQIPLFGICLGHQLIGLALGAKTAKLKFGHHGCNHPVKVLATGKVEITSQNHGFAVYADVMPDIEVTHVNLNDQTIEGLRHKTLPVMSVQYHPEAAAGPHDSENLFNKFRNFVQNAS